MASQRFALQRKLAELPQFPVTAETADHLADAINRINIANTGDVAETAVGPVINTAKGPVRMQLTIAEDAIDPISDHQLGRMLAHEIGQMGQYGLVDAISGAREIRDVSFSMVDPSGRPI